MNISEPFIRRPIATSLLMFGLLVFGLGAYSLLPVAAVPNVDFPTITVTAQYPGANPSTMASAVATPLEHQFISIPDLSEMTSWSGVGVTSITLQFNLEPQHRCRRGRRAAGDQCGQRPVAQGHADPADLPQGEPGQLCRPDLRHPFRRAAALQDRRIRDQHHRAPAVDQPGVGQVFVFGSMPYAARVQINPASLAAKRLGLEDVRNALVAASVNRPKGAIESSDQSIAIDTNDQLYDAAQYGNVMIAYRNGAPVRIKDVGDVIELGAEHPAGRVVRRPAGRGHRHPEGAGRQHHRRGRPGSRH